MLTDTPMVDILALRYPAKVSVMLWNVGTALDLYRFVVLGASGVVKAKITWMQLRRDAQKILFAQSTH
ncbi:hypothetical protein H310_06000 [Aphanomyces invadans]|uniref:Uncharacterized protein n=1 Tax=Aphanomyces invadans TaxID=157072 RepID=A0A024U7U9_9STRA|nr:hypothetical protein H310_06000 [Aphanomyces invadans]ETW02501.1 hypothetical protein H310_06000 [Aphanomyces invadans]|eukprot:XP_008869106.1 hypothetical protein H310_06000 [Aphanomyces invadans]